MHSRLVSAAPAIKPEEKPERKPMIKLEEQPEQQPGPGSIVPAYASASASMPRCEACAVASMANPCALHQQEVFYVPHASNPESLMDFLGNEGDMLISGLGHPVASSDGGGSILPNRPPANLAPVPVAARWRLTPSAAPQRSWASAPSSASSSPVLPQVAWTSASSLASSSSSASASSSANGVADKQRARNTSSKQIRAAAATAVDSDYATTESSDYDDDEEESEGASPQNDDTNKKRKLTSKYLGVCWYKRTKKWVCQIKIDGKRKHIGYFTDEAEAGEAYDNALRELVMAQHAAREAGAPKARKRTFNSTPECFQG